MIILIKAIAIFLAAIAISKSYLAYRKNQEPLIMLVFWSIVWLTAAILVTYPILIEKLSAFTQDETLTIGSISSIAFVFMLFIVYRVYAKATRIEHQLADLVRKLALNDNKKRNHR